MDEPTDGSQPCPLQETLAAIRDGMAHCPAPWPQGWQQEYVDTIREAMTIRPEDPQYAKRLQILREGFGPCWERWAKNTDRPHFEVRRAQIRWYVENLMAAVLPDNQAKETLRRQYEDLADHGAGSLLAQFPFLDPNVVRKAKADYLADWQRGIEAPLLPIFLTPLSEAQVERLKQRWHDLRYARVDLWRQLGAATETPVAGGDAASVRSHPDYLLTQRSLGQWQAHIWALAGPAPDYYCAAVDHEIETRRRRMEARSEARRQEARLPVAVLQTEYLSFLFAALLETANGIADEGGDE